MSVDSASPAPVTHELKGSHEDMLLPALAVAVVGGIVLAALTGKIMGLVILPMLTMTHSRPQGWREYAFAISGVVVVMALLAGAMTLDDWRMGPGEVATPWQNRDAFSPVLFLPAFLAHWITIYFVGRRAIPPKPEDELSWLDMGLTQGMAFFAAIFVFSAVLGSAVNAASTTPVELGCGMPFAMQFMSIMFLLYGGITVLLAWPQAGRHKTALLGRLGLGLIAIGLAHYGGRWIDCALEGGWLGFIGFALSLAIYIATVTLAAKNISRFARRHNLLRPPEWDAPDGGEGGATCPTADGAGEKEGQAP